MEPTESLDPCECGCGIPAGVYKTSNSAEGIRAGQPKRFIHNHHSRVQVPRGRAFSDCYTVLPNGCWQWNDVRADEDGYGRFWSNGRNQSAHRYSYEQAHGSIPRDVHIDHLCHDPKTCAGGSTCRHRACVNPDHLGIASHADNCRRGALAKLDMAKAREIRHRFRAGEMGVSLAREFGVRPSTISMVVRNKTWNEDR